MSQADVVLRTRPDSMLSLPLVAPLVETLLGHGVFQWYDHLQRQTRTLSTNGRIVAGCVRQRSDPAQFDLSDVSFTAKRAAMADFADKFNITEVAQWILADGRYPSPEFFLRRHFDAARPTIEILPYPRDSLNVLKLSLDLGRGSNAFFLSIC